MPKRDSQGRFLPKNATDDRQPHEQAHERWHAENPSPAERARQMEEYPAADVYPEADGPYGYAYREPASGAGLLKFVLTLAVLAVLAWLIIDKVTANRTPPSPAPAPVVAPSSDLRVHTDPIKQKLAYDPAKARIVRDAYAGFRDALAGPSGKRVSDSRVLETVQKSFLEDLQTNTGTSVGAEIDAAIGGYLGIERSKDEKTGEEGWEPKSFDDSDRKKLAEIVGAISRAAEESL